MELRYLSPAFYSKYKNCPEIMSKGETRPYIILIIEIENNKFAIPIRTIYIKQKIFMKVIQTQIRDLITQKQ